MVEFNMTDATQSGQGSPIVGLIMGSSSDWDVMQHAAAMLDEFDIAHETRVISAHRMPHEMVEYGAGAAERGLRAIITGAGGAAHLPGMMAALTPVPVFGVPVPSRYLRGEDSLLSRSEEQTSELQSIMRISYAVFCLKKKK